MSKTLTGTYGNGYTLSGASQGVLNPVTVTGSIDIGGGVIPGALYAQGPNAWTVTNQGSISGGLVAGIDLAAGGLVINAATGSLSGHLGIAIQGTLGGVTNSGTIRAVNAGSSATANQAIGIILTAGGSVSNQLNAQITGQGAGVDILGGAGTVVNAGTISGPAYEGVYLDHGAVTNLSTGIISGGSIAGGGSIGAGGSIVTSGWGIAIRNGGTLFNAGVVTGVGQGGAFLGGGTATNQGTMTGVWGIAMTGATGTVINSGSLNGNSQSGVFLTGGNVTNASGGRITGISGVVIRTAAGTVANSGFIGATSLTGYGVYLAPGFTNRVLASPGAVFSGLVDGGNAVGAAVVSTLELTSAASQGTLGGLGTQFINFGQTVLDAGASWSLTGQNSLVSGASLSNAGTLTIDGAMDVHGAFGGAGSVTVASASSVVASVSVGAGGVWSGGSGLTVGSSGAGSFLVNNNGTVSAAAAVFGANAGGTGGLDVNGAQFSTSGLLTLGQAGSGRMVVENQGSVTSGGTAAGAGIVLGLASGGAGDLTVTGGLSLLNNAGAFVVGNAGMGSLSVLSGGTVLTSPGTVAGPAGLVIGNLASAAGSSATVSGAGSKLQVTGLLDVGVFGSGALSLSGGATVTAGSLDAGNIATAVGQISVSGAGTKMTVTGDAVVADDGTGVLSVLDGASFSATNLTIGSQGDSSGALVVSGSGSVINLTGSLNIGTALGVGDLTIGPGGAVHAAVVNLQGQVVLEGGNLDPTVTIINQGQTAGGNGTIQAGFIVDEGVVQAGGTKPSQRLLIVDGTVVGGGTLTVNGTVQPSGPVGVLQINASGTLELTGPVLNAATTTFTDNLAQPGTYTINNSVVDVTFADGKGVLLLDKIGGFAGTITSFLGGDSFVITGGTLSNLGVSNSNTLTFSDSGVNAGGGGIDQIIFGAGVSAANFNIVNGNTVQVACFAAGTRIGTAAGWTEVENLAPGDLVATDDGRLEPVVWIGSRAVNCEAHPAPETVWPVSISAGAFGSGLPARDLWLSPDHAVFVSGGLVPVKLLINGGSIAQVKRSSVTYYHVELPRHDVILAEGLAVESYLDIGDRMDFERPEEVTRLFPNFAASLGPSAGLAWETLGAAPLVLSGAALVAARAIVRSHTPTCGSQPRTSRSRSR